MLIKINISNIFLAFKYVKHYHLGQMLRSTFQSNLSHDKTNVKNKMTIPIINHKSLKKSLAIPKSRINHSCWALQTWKARKKIQDVSPLWLPSLGFSITFYSPNDV